MIYSASYARFIFPHIFRLKKHTQMVMRYFWVKNQVENSLRLLQMSAVLAECLDFEKKHNQKFNGKYFRPAS
jgi:hypothetical protein